MASVVSVSGGFPWGPPPDQDPHNLFAALIIHGGLTDWIGFSYPLASQSYRDALTSRGSYSILCDHGGGHDVPGDNVLGAKTWQFLQDHRYGTSPSPYAGGLPTLFTDICK
jgi:hypothetical protein